MKNGRSIQVMQNKKLASAKRTFVTRVNGMPFNEACPGIKNGFDSTVEAITTVVKQVGIRANIKTKKAFSESDI